MVVVIAETDDGKIRDSTFELITMGRELADKTGDSVTLVVLGASTDELSGLGRVAKVVLIRDEAFQNYEPHLGAQALVNVISGLNPKIILTTYSSSSMDLVTPLAKAVDGTLLSGVQDLDYTDGSFTATCLLYGGKLLATSVAKPCLVASMMPGARSADDGRADGKPEVKEFDTGSVSPKIHFKTLHLPDASDVDIATQDILVSVGRGIQDGSNIELAEELAEKLGATVSGSRPVIDQGWLPKTRQVGKSGKTVKPKLYLMLGISGAPEHVEAIRNAEMIIAVNTDANAPIFDLADYGINVDLFDFVEELLDALD